MGDVYLARDPTIGRQVAIKVLRTNSDEYRRRFRVEITAAGSLRHRNIVTIFDSGEHDGAPYLAMEFIPGETLAYLIERREPLPLAEKLRYIEELCEGLAHAHAAGIIHRDIKPANVVIDRDGNCVKVLDFGIARFVSADTTQSGVLAGTLVYMSPEQIMGARVDPRTDIFSAGLVLYELVAYQRAFTGGWDDGLPHRILNDDPQPLESLVPGIDPGIVAIVSRALKKNPAERYPDARAMATDLKAAAVRAIGGAAPPSIPIRRGWPEGQPLSFRAIVAAAIVVIVALVASVVLPRLRVIGGSDGEIPERQSAVTSPPVGAQVGDAAIRAAERQRSLELVQSRLQAGDKGGALAAIETGLRADGQDPESTRLLRQMFADARQQAEAAQARARPNIGTQPDRRQPFDGMSALMANAAATTAVTEMPAAIRTLWTAEIAFRQWEKSAHAPKE
jgi:eukaryotic-like serine/threonine-protein kinase